MLKEGTEINFCAYDHEMIGAPLIVRYGRLNGNLNGCIDVCGYAGNLIAFVHPPPLRITKQLRELLINLCYAHYGERIKE